MQRPLTAVFGLAAVALAIGVVAHNFRSPKAEGYGTAVREAGDDSSPMFAQGEAAPAADEGATPLLVDGFRADLRIGAGAGASMPDGSPVPALPFAAPRQVRFGIVLVSFSGAQPNPGQPPVSRSMADAKRLAENLLATAAQDFHAAVQQGDPGSAEDIGRVRLGVLEPAPEYVLFTLPVGGVGGPVETPRGYWIVKRLE